MNKCDRPTREPLELLDELEKVLGIGAFPVNWPLGNGPRFRGVYDRLTHQAHMFERTVGGKYAAPVDVTGLDDPSIREKLDEHVYVQSREEIEMLQGAGESYDQERVLAGEVTPVYFGVGAMNNFGVQLLLDGFLEHSAAPGARKSVGDKTAAGGEPRLIRAGGPEVQRLCVQDSGEHGPEAPRPDRVHTDRVGEALRAEMTVVHVQSGMKIRLSNAQKLFGQQRETVEDGRAGDVVGIVGHDVLRIGDTLAEDRTAGVRRRDPAVHAGGSSRI